MWKGAVNACAPRRSFRRGRRASLRMVDDATLSRSHHYCFQSASTYLYKFHHRSTDVDTNNDFQRVVADEYYCNSSRQSSLISLSSLNRSGGPLCCSSFLNQHRPQLQRPQQRHASSWLPDVVQNFSIWGGSGFALKMLHMDGAGLPYWACFAVINIFVRIALCPLVLFGAQMSSKFAKVIPEVQFLLSLFANDMRTLRANNAPLKLRLQLMKTNFRSLSGIYKLHKIHPFAIFLSPLLQLPIFCYVAIDLRKIVNGLDPMLAQQLVEGGVGWIPDLTEPDPWFALPVLAGLGVYWNVEVATGQRSLSGPAAAKSDTGMLLKDVFQSVAIFMPCFTSQLPSGVQIYLTTSFAFTIAQSAALRTESFRRMVGLPSMLAPPPEATTVHQFVDLKKLEQKAKEIRGDSPVLGKGVLAHDWQLSFPGTFRKSTIRGSSDNNNNNNMPYVPDQGKSSESVRPTMAVNPPHEGPFVHGISAPTWQLIQQQEEQAKKLAVSTADPERADNTSTSSSNEREYMPQYTDEVMAKANRGELPVATKFVARKPPSSTTTRLSLKGISKGKKGSASSKRNRG